MSHSNIPKIPTLLAAAGLAVALVLGFVLNTTPAFADKTAFKHNHGGGGDDTSGGAQDIPLCMTLATAVETGGITAIDRIDALTFPYAFQTFCHNEGDLFHAEIRRKDGALAITMQPGPIEGIQLDFRACVGFDPNCAERDFGAIVNGTPPNERRRIDQLAVLEFSIEDFPVLGAADVDLTVQFQFFHIQEDPPGTIRGINYGPSVTGTNFLGISEDCVDGGVSVMTEGPGTWTVESDDFFGDQACLFRQTGHGGNTEIELQGKYHMPFQLVLQAFSGDFDADGCPLRDDGTLLVLPLPSPGPDGCPSVLP